MSPLPITTPPLSSSTPTPIPNTNNHAPRLLPTSIIILLSVLSTLITLALLLTLYTLYQRHLYRGLARYWIWKTEPPLPPYEARRGARITGRNARFYGPGMHLGLGGNGDIDAGGGREAGVELGSLGGDEVEMKTLRAEEGKFRFGEVGVKVPGSVYGGWRGTVR